MHRRDDTPQALTAAVLPTISVVVPFIGREQCVLDCLQSVLEMDYPEDRLEVIAVDDSGDGALGGRVRTLFPKVKLISNAPPLGCDQSKQAGIDASIGEIIAFTDADCTVHPQWASVMAERLCDGVHIATGPVRHPQTLLRELIGISDFPDYQAADHRWLAGFPGCNFAVRREVLTKTRYYRSGSIQGGSDRLVSWHLHSLGYKIRHDPRMVVYHAPAIGLANLLERRQRYGRQALALRRLDPTLPGGMIVRLGPVAFLAYISYKAFRDPYCLFRMARDGVVNRWHVPLLLPSLFVFRLVDAVGMISAQFDGQEAHTDGRHPSPESP